MIVSKMTGCLLSQVSNVSRMSTVLGFKKEKKKTTQARDGDSVEFRQDFMFFPVTQQCGLGCNPSGSGL